MVHTCSSSTSSANFMFFVWIRKISRRPVASGIPISTSLSNRPEAEIQLTLQQQQQQQQQSLLCS